MKNNIIKFLVVLGGLLLLMSFHLAFGVLQPEHKRFVRGVYGECKVNNNYIKNKIIKAINELSFRKTSNINPETARYYDDLQECLEDSF